MAEEQATSAAPAAPVTQVPARPQRHDGGRPPRGPRGPRQQLAPEEKQFDERVVHIDRVARVVKGGRRFRFRALVVVGDRKGKVGIGTAKGADVTAAVSKATEVAKKHLVKVILYKGTLPHEVEAKVSGAKILIMPAAPGTGLIAGGVVRTVLEVAGVSNALSKSLGSSNKTNIAYATIEALQALVASKNWVTTKHTVAKTTSKKADDVKAVPAKKTDEVKPAPVKKESSVKTVAKKPAATKAKPAKKEAK